MLSCICFTLRSEAAAVFKHHSGAITSVEWHPDDSTVFASAGEDDQVRVRIDTSVCCMLRVSNIYGSSVHAHVHMHTHRWYSGIWQWRQTVETPTHLKMFLPSCSSFIKVRVK